MMALGLAGFAADLNTLRVVPMEGDAVLFHVDGKPELKLDGSTLTIAVTTGDAPSEFEIEKISHVDFVHTDKVGVESVADDDALQLSRTGKTLHAEGLPENSKINVYTIDGRCLIDFTASGSAGINFENLPSAIYIVKINQFTFKTRF